MQSYSLAFEGRVLLMSKVGIHQTWGLFQLVTRALGPCTSVREVHISATPTSHHQWYPINSCGLDPLNVKCEELVFALDDKNQETIPQIVHIT